MKTKLLQLHPERTYAVIFEEGDEVASGLLQVARRENLAGSRFSGIGAFSSAILGYFDLERHDYKRIPIAEQVEVVSLLGNIALSDGEPKIHAHVVLAKRDGSAHGGHLLEAHVRPTLEVIVTEAPEHLQRTYSPEFNLPLITL